MIVNRAAQRDTHPMPPVGSLIPDQSGNAVVSEWSDSLTGC
jgi:hypothetical protein